MRGVFVALSLLVAIQSTSALPICWTMTAPRICKQCVKPKQKCAKFSRTNFNLVSYTSGIAKEFNGKPCHSKKKSHKWITCMPTIPKSMLLNTYYMVSAHGFEYAFSGDSYEGVQMIRLTGRRDKKSKQNKKIFSDTSNTPTSPWRFDSVVHFFDKDYTTLDEIDAVPIQNAFDNGKVVDLQNKVVATYSGTKPYIEHYAKFGEGFEGTSGIYRLTIDHHSNVKKKVVKLELLIDIPVWTRYEPISLTDIVTFLDTMGPAPIFWNACRETYKRVEPTTSIRELYERWIPLHGIELKKFRNNFEVAQKNKYSQLVAATKQMVKDLEIKFKQEYVDPYINNKEIIEELKTRQEDLVDVMQYYIDKEGADKKKNKNGIILSLIYIEREMQREIKGSYKEACIFAQEEVLTPAGITSAQRATYNNYHNHLVQRRYNGVFGRKQEIVDKDKLIEYEEIMSILKGMKN
eukprot:403107_1